MSTRRPASPALATGTCRLRRATLVAALTLPAQALGATLVVPDQFPTLEDAVAASNGNDTIQLRAGTYDTEITVPHNLIISRASPADVVTLVNTVGTSGSVITASGIGSLSLSGISFGPSGDNRAVTTTGVVALILSNVTADGMTSTGDGGFVSATGSQAVSITNFQGTNGSAVNGGMFAFVGTGTNATVTIQGSQFEGGTATGDGGIVLVRGMNLISRDSLYIDGEAARGGALFTEDPTNTRTLLLERLQVTEGFASEVGGGLFAHGVSVDLAESTFTDNLAGSGGAVWADEGTTARPLKVDTNAVFTGNAALGGGTSPDGALGVGGALAIRGTTIQLDDLTVDTSEAVDGAVWLAGAGATLRRLTFTGNTATGDGGALSTDLTGALIVEDSAFDLNQADRGGAIAAIAGSLLLDTDTFTGNVADADGGAVWASDAGLDVIASRFHDGDATRGGAVFRTGATGAVSLTGSTWFRNTANSGGAVFAEGVEALGAERNLWCENVAATGAGGAVRATATDGAATFTNEGAGDNAADTNGGVYALDGFDEVALSFSTFAGNEANNGAALHLLAGGTTTLARVAAVDQVGSAFHGTGTVTADTVGFLGNTADFGGAWAGTSPATPVTLAVTPVFNNHPAATCEELRLYPRPSSELIDVGPGTADLDGSATDVGLSGGPDADPALFLDVDGDGFDRLLDCDDTNPDSRPDAEDVCNDVDDDCDGLIDEDPATQWFPDLDGDDYGVPGGAGIVQCDPPGPNLADNTDDCDDTDPLINPDGEETCDGEDQDCDGVADNDAVDALSFAQDQDFDGFGTDAASTLACTAPPGFTDVLGDCDDTRSNVYPGAPELCDTLDNDCDDVVDIGALNAPTWYPDLDGDGWGDDAGEVVQCLSPIGFVPEGGDCDDADPDRSPGQDEVCDGVDNDCDGTTDVDPVAPLYFVDADLDGFGDEATAPVGSCVAVPGLIEVGGDCDDADDTVFPGAEESCDGVDEDCDGSFDNDPIDGDLYYLDADSDGFGADDFEVVACFQPAFASPLGGDCDDANEVMFPGNTEVCDFFDNDCDGEVDEDDAADAPTWYQDLDADGFGSDDVTVVQCRLPFQHVPAGGDCNDNNPTAFPGRAEVCDGVDNDCDGVTDGENAQDVEFFFEDADGDGYGNDLVQIGACEVPEGYTTNGEDCDDSDEGISPAAVEVPGNAVDENCDGQLLNEEGPGDTDTDAKNCSCSSSPNVTWGLLPLLGALALRRRRQA